MKSFSCASSLIFRGANQNPIETKLPVLNRVLQVREKFVVTAGNREHEDDERSIMPCLLQFRDNRGYLISHDVSRLLTRTLRSDKNYNQPNDCNSNKNCSEYLHDVERKGFYPQCQRDEVEQSNNEALRIKPCWTEPLVTEAKLASSMGIVKRKALETKLVQQDQVSRLKLGAGRVVFGRRVDGVREGACGHKGLARGQRSG